LLGSAAARGSVNNFQDYQVIRLEMFESPGDTQSTTHIAMIFLFLKEMSNAIGFLPAGLIQGMSGREFRLQSAEL
jgi:hypothetical protein